jgi:hypothetical protein
MAWSSPPTYTVGQVLTASNLNTYLRDNELWLGTRKWFSISRAAAVSIPNSTLTAFTFDTETTDTDNFGVVPSGAYTIPTGLAGVYAITARVAFFSGPGASGFGRLTVAGGTYDASASANGSLAGWTVVVPMAAADTVQLACFQNSGAAVNATCFVTGIWLGR